MAGQIDYYVFQQNFVKKLHGHKSRQITAGVIGWYTSGLFMVAVRSMALIWSTVDISRMTLSTVHLVVVRHL